MPKGVVQIPVPVLLSVETLDELQDWLTAQNPEIMRELREARQEDLAGKFRHTSWMRNWRNWILPSVPQLKISSSGWWRTLP